MVYFRHEETSFQALYIRYHHQCCFPPYWYYSFMYGKDERVSLCIYSFPILYLDILFFLLSERCTKTHRTSFSVHRFTVYLQPDFDARSRFDLEVCSGYWILLPFLEIMLTYIAYAATNILEKKEDERE